MEDQPDTNESVGMSPKNPLITVKGTVAQDLELKETPSNKTFVTVLVAAHFVERDGVKLDPEEHKWHQATYWNDQASEVMNQLKKGSKVEITGDQRLNEYEKDGELRTASEIRNPKHEVLSLEIKGMVAKDPELQLANSSGLPFARVLIAADEITKAGVKLDPDQNKWHHAVFFGERAKAVCEELKKGMVVDLDGEHKVQSYTDRQGAEQKASELLAPKVNIRSLEIRGTVAQDPEVKYTANNKPYARLLVAADEVTRGNTKLDPAENKWHVAVCWGDKAEALATTYKKGMDVRVVGEQRISHYQGRDGQARSASELHMPKIEVFERQRTRAQGLGR